MLTGNLSRNARNGKISIYLLRQKRWFFFFPICLEKSDIYVTDLKKKKKKALTFLDQVSKPCSAFHSGKHDL